MGKIGNTCNFVIVRIKFNLIHKSYQTKQYRLNKLVHCSIYYNGSFSSADKLMQSHNPFSVNMHPQCVTIILLLILTPWGGNFLKRWQTTRPWLSFISNTALTSSPQYARIFAEESPSSSSCVDVDSLSSSSKNTEVDTTNCCNRTITLHSLNNRSIHDNV